MAMIILSWWTASQLSSKGGKKPRNTLRHFQARQEDLTSTSWSPKVASTHYHIYCRAWFSHSNLILIVRLSQIKSRGAFLLILVSSFLNLEALAVFRIILLSCIQGHEVWKQPAEKSTLKRAACRQQLEKSSWKGAHWREQLKKSSLKKAAWKSNISSYLLWSIPSIQLRLRRELLPKVWREGINSEEYLDLGRHS